MPGWVKLSLVLIAVLVALFVILSLAGIGGRHGPGRHASSVSHTLPSTVDRSA